VSEAIRFLHALAQALSTMALYSPGHPAARRGIEGAWQALTALLAREGHPAFLFLGSAPIYGGRALHELAGWPWSARLADVAVQRIDFDRIITVEVFESLLDQLQLRLSGGDDVGEVHLLGVSYGPVVVEEAFDDGEQEPSVEPEAESTRLVAVDLSDELDAMRFVLAEARGGRVARAEVEAVARLLVALASHHALPQAEARDQGDPAVQAVNTALLVLAAGAKAGLGPDDLHPLAVAALWHDIGVMRLPFDLATKSSLSESERVVVEQHTVLGATLLLSQGSRTLRLAASVAFEHHLRPDGTGYPSRRLGQSPHWVSSLIGAAAAYVAVRTARPYRAAWTPERALSYLRSGEGVVFGAEAARLLAEVVAP
jgi:putative two-component system response regulator